MSITLNHLYPTARRPLIACEDDEGHLIVHVDLGKGRFAVVDHTDFARLMDLGLSPNWVYAPSGGDYFYVRVKPPKSFPKHTLASISRFILPPERRGVVVRHRDGDVLNLRRSNLEHANGQTLATAWEWDVVNGS